MQYFFAVDRTVARDEACVVMWVRVSGSEMKCPNGPTQSSVCFEVLRSLAHGREGQERFQDLVEWER